MARYKFHVTRHTVASLLIADGMRLRVVMELLRHSQISTTANTYGHVLAEALREAADAMDRALGKGPRNAVPTRLSTRNARGDWIR